MTQPWLRGRISGKTRRRRNQNAFHIIYTWESEKRNAVAILAEAAGVISKEPVALQLRYLQTLTEIGVEKNTTVVFPVPIDILRSWMRSST